MGSTSGHQRLRPSARQRKALAVVGTVGFALAVWAMRRPDQLSHPYVWVEEADLVRIWQEGGVLDTVTANLAGYLLVPSTLSVALALELGLLDLPRNAYLFATAWYVATALLWLLPESELPLRTRVGFVAAMALVPTDPEVFGVALYSFWWVQLWPVPLLFWRRPHTALKVPLLLLSGLSGLAGAALFVLYLLAWWVRRWRADLASAAVLAAAFGLQLVIYLGSDRASELPVDLVDIGWQTFANLGMYATGWLDASHPTYWAFLGLLLTGAMLALVVAPASGLTGLQRLTTGALLATLLGFSLLSAIPAPRITHPHVNGPRYFFLPFVVFSWFLISVVTSSATTIAKQGAAGLLALSLLTLGPAWSRSHERLDWRTQVLACKAADGPVAVDVHLDGSTAVLWNVVITPETCDRL